MFQVQEPIILVQKVLWGKQKTGYCRYPTCGIMIGASLSENWIPTTEIRFNWLDLTCRTPLSVPPNCGKFNGRDRLNLNDKQLNSITELNLDMGCLEGRNSPIDWWCPLEYWQWGYSSWASQVPTVLYCFGISRLVLVPIKSSMDWNKAPVVGIFVKRIGTLTSTGRQDVPTLHYDCNNFFCMTTKGKN